MPIMGPQTRRAYPRPDSTATAPLTPNPRVVGALGHVALTPLGAYPQRPLPSGTSFVAQAAALEASHLNKAGRAILQAEAEYVGSLLGMHTDGMGGLGGLDFDFDEPTVMPMHPIQPLYVDGPALPIAGAAALSAAFPAHAAAPPPSREAVGAD